MKLIIFWYYNGFWIWSIWCASKALFSRLISSSVFPENMDPQITSIQPPRRMLSFPICGSTNITGKLGVEVGFLLALQFLNLLQPTPGKPGVRLLAIYSNYKSDLHLHFLEQACACPLEFEPCRWCISLFRRKHASSLFPSAKHPVVFRFFSRNE